MSFSHLTHHSQLIIIIIYLRHNIAFNFRSAFGKEYEVSGCTKLDTHKAEEDVNHWMMLMSVPGDHTMSVTPPKDDSK